MCWKSIERESQAKQLALLEMALKFDFIVEETKSLFQMTNITENGHYSFFRAKNNPIKR